MIISCAPTQLAACLLACLSLDGLLFTCLLVCRLSACLSVCLSVCFSLPFLFPPLASGRLPSRGVQATKRSNMSLTSLQGLCDLIAPHNLGGGLWLDSAASLRLWLEYALGPGSWLESTAPSSSSSSFCILVSRRVIFCVGTCTLVCSCRCSISRLY